MSYETEKILRLLRKHIEAADFSDDDETSFQEKLDSIVAAYNAGELTEEMSAEDEAYDLLEEAMYADTEKDARRLAKLALKMYPGLLDAEAFLLSLEEHSDKLQKKYETLLVKEKKRLDEEYSEEDEGHYYGILPTRPYIRLYAQYVNVLESLGKIRKAANEAETILKLNTNDNLGLRYRLMIFYSYLEDVQRAEDLLIRYDEQSVNFLLPLIMLYYKVDQIRKAKKYLKELIKVYPRFIRDYSDVFAIFVEGEEIDFDDDRIDEIAEWLSGPGYQMDHPSEIIEFLMMSAILTPTMPGFTQWLTRQ